VEFWENKIIPLIEDKIRVEWAYSSEQDVPEAEDAIEDVA